MLYNMFRPQHKTQTLNRDNQQKYEFLASQHNK